MAAADDPKPWETLALAAALPGDRELLAVLMTFDARLARIVMTSSEPMLGQIRLAWWRDVLDSDSPPKGEPLIARFRQLEPGWPLAGDMLRMVDGWEARLLTPEQREDYAAKRGGGLFRAFAGPGAIAGVEETGHLWALADVGHGVERPSLREFRLWPRRLRPLSVLTLGASAQGRLAGLRLSWHGLTGR